MVGNVGIGSRGEQIAALYLVLDGYRVLDTNYRSGSLEIDLVAAKSGCLAFVEVKTRRGDSFGSAVEAVGRAKVGHLRRAARAYLREHRAARRYDLFRIDLVTIDIDRERGAMTLRHLKGIA